MYFYHWHEGCLKQCLPTLHAMHFGILYAPPSCLFQGQAHYMGFLATDNSCPCWDWAWLHWQKTPNDKSVRLGNVPGELCQISTRPTPGDSCLCPNWFLINIIIFANGIDSTRAIAKLFLRLPFSRLNNPSFWLWGEFTVDRPINSNTGAPKQGWCPELEEVAKPKPHTEPLCSSAPHDSRPPRGRCWIMCILMKRLMS